jgi:hypothetical protein
MDRVADDPALQPLIVLRVVIRSPDLETFVTKYSRFVKDDRIFIFTKSSQPPGTRVRFTLELADGKPLINGEGTVTRIRPDVGDPAKPPGMELRFTPLDEPSQKLLLRMLAARELTARMPDQQTAPIVMGTESSPIAISDRFRDEVTDVDDDLVTMPPRPPVIDSHPVLEPLQKTGVQNAISDDDLGQDESGAVTLSQGGPAGARGSGSEVPSGAFTSPDALSKAARPPPIPPLAKKAEDRPSGSFSTPTPLPMPIPASASDEPLHVGPPLMAPTRMDKLSSLALDKLTAATSGDEGAFASAGPAPPFAEAFKSPLAAPPSGNGHQLAPNGTLPANPFSEVSDGAIEYFVEWSVEQSTAPHPKARSSSFANVAMMTPRKERQRSTVRPLLIGTFLGLLLGVPLGGAAVWMWSPVPVPVIVEQMPQVERVPPPAEAEDKPPVAPRPEAPILARVEPKPAAKKEPASKPIAKPVEKAATAATVTKEEPAEKTAATAATEKPAEKPSEKPADKPLVASAKTKEPAEDESDKSDNSEKSDKGEPQKEQLRGDKATVQILSHPPGAAITVDGEARGKTPLILQLATGQHQVELSRERYATVTQTVEAPGKLDVSLHRPTATLHVDSDPPGGDVAVEGKPRGKAPVDVTLEAFHHYEVQVTLLGTRPFKKRVVLKPPQVEVNAKLEVVHK